MGSRMLKRWLHQPVRNISALDQRLDAIGEMKDVALFTELQPTLKQIGDIERILARLALRSARHVIWHAYAKRWTIFQNLQIH